MIDWPAFLSIDARIDFWTILVGIVGNAACAILGCFLVLRRMSLLGDAISHAVLAGVAGAFWLTGTTTAVPMFVGALIIGVLTAFLTQALHTFGRVPEDSSMGVVFTSLFAVGVIVISQFRGVHLDVECVLEGRLDTVFLDTAVFLGRPIPRVLQSLVPVLGLVVLFTLLFWKELKVASFDPTLATAMGFNAVLVHYLLMTMVAATTVASLQAVGAIMVIAMLIVPPATAQLLTDRLGRMIALAVLAGTTAAIFGCLLARRLSTNAAGMMTVVAGLQFAAAVLLAPRYGLLSKLAGNVRLSLRIVSEDIIAMLYRHEERQPAENGRTAAASRAECLRFSGGGVTARLGLALLRRRGLVTAASGDGLELTPRGRRLGRTLVRSHRLWEAYLGEHFALPSDHLHEPAERIEHFIGPTLQERLAAELDRPETDPHGRAIPGGAGTTETRSHGDGGEGQTQ